jgi:hypothetical protein
MFFRIGFKQVPNERDFIGWPFQETYEYKTLFYRCRLRVLKRNDTSGIEIGFVRIFRWMPNVFWRGLERFGTFYRFMDSIGVVKSPILSQHLVFENLDRDYVLRKWGVDVRGLRENRIDKLDQILS